MYTAICENQPHLCHQWSLDERRTTSTTQRHKGGKLGIMKKSFNFLCKTFGSFGKTSYLCTRKPKGATNFGAVVQLVRILACHARGRGFEPRPHRKRGESAMILLISFRKTIPYYNNISADPDNAEEQQKRAALDKTALINSSRCLADSNRRRRFCRP